MIIHYRCVTNIDDLTEYIGKNEIVAFKFKTAPKQAFRNHENADMDPAKAIIIGASFAVREGTGIYVPIRHRDGKNMDTNVSSGFLNT